MSSGTSSWIPSKLHELNHKGEYFSITGPLNLSRSPQGQPVIFQSGTSEQGRNLAGHVAEGIYTHVASIEEGVRVPQRHPAPQRPLWAAIPTTS